METEVHKQLDLLPNMSKQELRAVWYELFKRTAPSQLRRQLLIRILAYKVQERAFGGLKPETRRRLREIARKLQADRNAEIVAAPRIKPGTRLIREWHGQTLHVTVLDEGYEYAGKRYASLSEVARVITGTRWSGPLFFGLKSKGGEEQANVQ